ncbi:MAG: PspC domain-containing protein [Elusimicrobia bacterium]|nr:PspC domain-containing protein [Elusimicrobiota bacterium]
MQKQLVRSKKNRTILGILGGIGEYFGIDPTLVRLVFLFLFFITGIVPLLLVYFLAYFIIPSPSAS